VVSPAPTFPRETPLLHARAPRRGVLRAGRATSFKNPGLTTLTLHGFPGAQATLLLGRRPIVLDDPTVAVELLVDPAAVLPLGTMPASGKLDYDLPLGPAWPKSLMDGTPVFFAQAELVYAGGDVRRTNSVPIVLQVQ